jgi:hypothetical protein
MAAKDSTPSKNSHHSQWVLVEGEEAGAAGLGELLANVFISSKRKE